MLRSHGIINREISAVLPVFSTSPRMASSGTSSMSALKSKRHPPFETRTLSDAIYRTADLRSDSVYTVDINPIVCHGAPLCLPVVNGTVVWKNPTHLTTDITRQHSGAVWRAVRRSGALEGLG